MTHLGMLLKLSVRAEKALKNAGINTVKELCNCDWRKFATKQSCGVMTIAEIANAVIRLASGDALKQEKAILIHEVIREEMIRRMRIMENKIRRMEEICME